MCDFLKIKNQKEQKNIMYYALNKNVYLVKGKARSCIYDFNSSKLYSINGSLSKKIDLVNKGKICVDSLDKDLISVFQQFIDLGILITVESPDSHEINEIKSDDDACSFSWIEITTMCNLKCKHCYNNSDIHCDTTMSLTNYKLAIDSLLKLGVSKIQLIGGEPFIDKKILKEMLDYTIDKIPLIEIFTNGTLITDEWFDYIAKHNIRIALSVYSYREEIHDNITKIKGSWRKTNETIKKLKKHNIVYRVCNVLMKDVAIEKKTTELYTLSSEKDIVRMSGRANFALLTDDLIKRQLITKFSFKEPLRKQFCKTLLCGHNCFQSRIYISADMTVYPCVMERRISHCVIDQENGIKLNDSIRFFNKDKIHECCECEYRYICFDCRPNSLSGNLYEKPWYCTYNPLLGEWENVEHFITNLKLQWSN